MGPGGNELQLESKIRFFGTGSFCSTSYPDALLRIQKELGTLNMTCQCVMLEGTENDF